MNLNGTYILIGNLKYVKKCSVCLLGKICSWVNSLGSFKNGDKCLVILLCWVVAGGMESELIFPVQGTTACTGWRSS